MNTKTAYGLASADLRAHRKAAGLTQAALARLAGCAREAVQYWEGQPALSLQSALLCRLCALVGMRGFATSMRAHVGWGLTRDTADREVGSYVWQQQRDRRDAAVQALLSRVGKQRADKAVLRESHQAALRKVRCGALTRKATACWNWSEPGRRRCKFHGSRSTGPTTPEGRARIADAQRRRWAAWRTARDESVDRACLLCWATQEP
jgi:transcriptional regulator with XRE-family HTH domain